MRRSLAPVGRAPGRSRRSARRRTAFTLIEMIAVIVILGILSMTAIPAMSVIERNREASHGREIERMLSLARATAMATGRPCGVRFGVVEDTAQLRWIGSAGAAPSPMPGATGDPSSVDAFASNFAGASIVGFVNGDGSDALDTIWFAYNGAPELRQADGTLIGPFTQDASLTVGGGVTIVVRRLSGMIHR